MKMAEKHGLLQITNRIWLMDLANAIQPISETYFVMYTKQANDIKKAHLLEYYKHNLGADLLKIIFLF